MKIPCKDRQRRLADCAFVFLIVVISFLPFVSGLGFYSDDWSYEAKLAQKPNGSVAGAIIELVKSDSSMAVRPVQAVFLASEYKIFGQNALPYHVIDCVILGLTVVVLYLAIDAIVSERLFAVSIALVFGMLPHYSTDKLWISSQQATLCVGFACLGIYALQKLIGSKGKYAVQWTSVALVALTLCFLSYEVSMGIIAAALAYTAWRWWREARASPETRLSVMIGIVAVTLALLSVGLTKLMMQTRIVYHHHFFRSVAQIGNLISHAMVQGVVFNCWSYGMHLPAVLVAMYRSQALTFSSLAVATIVAVSVSAYVWKFSHTSLAPTNRRFILLLASGFVVFELGFALFGISTESDFSRVGLNDRLQIASALGAACVEVAFVGLLCSLLKPAIRMRVLSVIIGIICGVNCLASSGIAYFWLNASTRQSAILDSVSSHLRNLPKGSTLLLDGFCRYSGPGVVFETDWDTTGAVQLALHDYSLRADVVSRSLLVNDRAIGTTMYGNAEGRYEFGDNLYIYNVQRTALVPLTSKQAAVDYFEKINPSKDSGCPFAQEGSGVKVF
jgi:hypothetical protein